MGLKEDMLAMGFGEHRTVRALRAVQVNFKSREYSVVSVGKCKSNEWSAFIQKKFLVILRQNIEQK